jgi:MFS family permease
MSASAVESRPSLAAAFPPRVRRVYLTHILACVGANMLVGSFFFFAKLVFHWGTQPSLMVAAAEGVFYVAGALGAHELADRLGRRRALVLMQAILAILAAVGWMFPIPAVVVPMLLIYMLCSAACWPMMESLIADDAGAELLSRRIATYNLIWSAVGTVTMAICGSVIGHAVWGIFAIAVVAHILAIFNLLTGRVEMVADGTAAVHHAVEPELLAQRKLALHLSRISLPATYVVVYTLIAIMPSLPVIQSFSPARQTVVASVWMLARFATFLALGASSWWHSRPRVLLVAAAVMLAAFLGVTLRLGDVMGRGSAAVTTLDQLLMIGWQIVLGLTMGLIYSASLYFGMVLSEGSTEHGGYHEALIGLGQVIGPACAYAAQDLRPGDTKLPVAAVAILISLTLVAAGWVTFNPHGRSESAG